MTELLSKLTRAHLDKTRAYFDSEPERGWASRGFHELLGRYYALMIPESATVLEIGCGAGDLLAQLPNREVTGVDLSPRKIERARSRAPKGRFYVQAGEELEIAGTFDFIIISETVNLASDVQALFEQALSAAHPGTRMLLNFYSSLWRPIFSAAAGLGLIPRAPESNWLGIPDVRNLLDLGGWETLKVTERILCPLPIPVIATVMNRFCAPLFPWFCLTCFCVARPRPARTAELPLSVSVVVPARNEAGNIEAIIQRTPELGLGTELIFVEGNSTDDTWARLQQAAAAHPQRKIKILQQSGQGKGNAVRDGFAVATGDILMILDADLTVPPEELPKFYQAVAARQAEFANGVRMVYPMESEAMQFLNLCANKAFSIIFSWLLSQPIKDTLCGTKVIRREDYQRLAANRAYFGEFDPFGDFDLLFGADKLLLKITDIPIRYRDRTYGQTNIQRWRHGWLLFQMVVFAARKLRFI